MGRGIGTERLVRAVDPIIGPECPAVLAAETAGALENSTGTPLVGFIQMGIDPRFNRRHVERHENILPHASAGAVILLARRNVLLVVIDVNGKKGADLLQIAGAIDVFCFVPGLIQRREQHGGKDGDDRDYDEEFYQSKTISSTEYAFRLTGNRKEIHSTHGPPLLFQVVCFRDENELCRLDSRTMPRDERPPSGSGCGGEWRGFSARRAACSRSPCRMKSC